MAVNVLTKLGVDLDTVRMQVEQQVGSGPDTKMAGNIPYTPRVKKVLALASKEAKALNHSYVGTEHLLLGLLREGEGVAAQVLRNLDVNLEKARNEILKELDPNFGGEEEEDEGESTGGSSAQKKESKTPALRAFGRDLTELAQKSELDPVIGRASEIERVIQILCRRTKNNPVLIGEAGVGKTAIVEGLAQEIAAGNVPELLRDKKVIVLDLALMVAGTKYRGQFEERIKAVMDEIRRTKNVILFLDELHTIVGAGSAEGAMDASNILKPALSPRRAAVRRRDHAERIPQIHREGRRARTPLPEREGGGAERRGRHQDPATGSRANTRRTTRRATRSRRWSRPCISAAATCRRAILPDKAIDIMDEAGAKARISAMTRPPELKIIEAEMDADPRREGDRHQGPGLREGRRPARPREGREEAPRRRSGKVARGNTERIVDVTEDDIMSVVSKWTGVPLQRMEQAEAEKLLKMEEELKKRVIGQDEAVIAISKALRRSRADLKDPQASHRLLHLPGPHRRRQNLPREEPRRVHVRLPPRRSSSSTCPNTWRSTPPAASSARLPDTSVTKRAASFPKPCAAVPIPSCFSTRSKRRTRM